VANAVGTSTRRASPTVGNASVDDTDIAMTFFFTTDDEDIIGLCGVLFDPEAHIHLVEYS
jgi:hypothetical protein